jgi:hypothetical protein
MGYYTALMDAWNGATQPPAGVTGTGLTGEMTTAQKIAAVNGWTIVGSIPTTFYVTGSQIWNCINWNELSALTDAQRKDVIEMCQIPGLLLGGSGNIGFATDGMIINYFTTNAAIASGTYNNSTGVVTLTMSASIKFGPSGNIVVSGLTGTGAFASLNGIFAPIAPTSGTTVTYNAGAGLGASTITGGSLVPPTITALTALAQATAQPWWQVPVAQGGGGLGGIVTTADTTLAGLS